MSLLGLGTSSVLSIFNNRKAQQAADASAAREQAFYTSKANEDPLSRSENQHILGQYDRQAQQQLETARNISTITGATPEFSAAVQKSVADGRTNLMGQMASNASAQKDRYEMMGEAARRRKDSEDVERNLARNNTYAALAGNAMSAAGAIMDGYNTPKAEAPAEIKVTEPQEQNHSKLVSATPPPTQSSSPIPHQNSVSVTTGEANAGFTANADGTYTKDGQIYVKGWDNVFRLKQ